MQASRTENDECQRTVQGHAGRLSPRVVNRDEVGVRSGAKHAQQ